MRAYFVFLIVATAASAAWATDVIQMAPANTPVITPGEGVEEEVPATPISPPKTGEVEPETPAEPPAPPPEFNMVRLQGLNKVTARISTLEAPLGAVARFGNLEIIAKRCWQAPPEEEPENAALLEVRELKPGEGPTTIFSGWMFASSPGLSGLEHPVYDITVLTCAYKENIGD